MGREIRRVAPTWEHPRNAQGNYIPLLDDDYETEAAEWVKNFHAWEAGTHEDQVKYPNNHTYYWEWAGGPPDSDSYRPKWDVEPTAYQVYETVSEGTPISPVFLTKDALVEWLVNDGRGMAVGGRQLTMSRAAAEAFADSGWAPTMIKGWGGKGVEDGVKIYEHEVAR